MVPEKTGILTGPTATGKSEIALEWAERHGGIEIINADSMLVYRGMDIGTAKPTPQERAKPPHHLIDIRNPDETFTAGEFYRECMAAIKAIQDRGKRALIVGGTGFYLKSLFFGLWKAPPAHPEIREALSKFSSEDLNRKLETIDPIAAQRIGLSDRYRLIRALELFQLTGKSPTELQSQMTLEPNPQFFLWIIDRPNSELYSRIQRRTQKMLEKGLVEEVQTLQKNFSNCRPLSAVGYAQVCDFISGHTPPGRKIKTGIEGLSDEIQLATRQLVKQQRTWFRNQKTHIPHPQSQWFQLDTDRPLLEETLKSVYL